MFHLHIESKCFDRYITTGAFSISHDIAALFRDPKHSNVYGFKTKNTRAIVKDEGIELIIKWKTNSSFSTRELNKKDSF